MSKSHKKARHKIGDGKTRREEKNFPPLHFPHTLPPSSKRGQKGEREVREFMTPAHNAVGKALVEVRVWYVTYMRINPHATDLRS